VPRDLLGGRQVDAAVEEVADGRAPEVVRRAPLHASLESEAAHEVEGGLIVHPHPARRVPAGVTTIAWYEHRRMKTYGFRSVDEARSILAKLGAPPRLVRHTVLVGEAADPVLDAMTKLGAPVNAHFVRLGVVFHDAGKIEHASELAGPGREHEPAGEALLLSADVDAAVARCCVSHARWADMEVSFEELVVALADTLWKGKRNEVLEKRVVEGAAAPMGRPFWDLFLPLDTCFEDIATEGPGRLARSVEA
jgi:hypothetical protein